MKTGLTVTANGEDFPVGISDDGMFRADLPGSVQLKAPSLDELQKKARKVKTKFELAFTQVDSHGARHGTVTGFHASTGNLLIRWDNGDTEQIPPWGGGGAMMPRLSDAETAEISDLVAARNKAVHDLDMFTRSRKFASLKKAAEAARAAAAEARGGQEKMT